MIEDITNFARGDGHPERRQAALAATLGPVLVPVVIGALAAAGVPTIYLVPLIGGAPTILYDAYSANRFRFARERDAGSGSTTFRTAVTYRLPGDLVRAIVTRDREAWPAMIRELYWAQLKPRRAWGRVARALFAGGGSAARARRRELAPVAVEVIRRLAYDSAAGATRLTLEVRVGHRRAFL